MTTFPSNQNRDWTATQAAPRRTPSPDAPTMAAYFPPTTARQAYGPTNGQPQLAWSAEQPEFNSAPAAYPAQQPWYARPRVLAFAGAGLVAAAAAGFFGAQYGPSSSTPVNTSAQSAPAPAPAPAPMPAAQPAAPSHRSTSHSAHSSMASGAYSAPASHQAPAQSPPAPQAQPSGDQSGQSYHDTGSDPSQWNNSGNYWWTHWRDHDSRWRGDHDSRWNFFNRNHDSGTSNDHDNSGSSDHDNSRSSNDQSSDSHSTGSNESGDSK